jgi:hypothetical protein
MADAPYGIPLIPNASLRLADVPLRGADWPAIKRFARTFDGYAEMGLERCGELANGQCACETLTDLRARLFFEYRRYNHMHCDPDEAKMAEVFDVLDLIRREVRDE